jgi:hypothetical protein
MTKKLTPKQRQFRQQNRWINKNYTAVTYRVKPEIAAAFREKCADWGISQASVISGTMKNFTEERITKMLKEHILTSPIMPKLKRYGLPFRHPPMISRMQVVEVLILLKQSGKP